MSLSDSFVDKHCYQDNPNKCTDKGLLTKLTVAHISKNFQFFFKEAAFTKPRQRFLYQGRSIQFVSFKKKKFEYATITRF